MPNRDELEALAFGCPTKKMHSAIGLVVLSLAAGCVLVPRWGRRKVGISIVLGNRLRVCRRRRQARPRVLRYAAGKH